MKEIEVSTYTPVRDENGVHFEVTKHVEKYTDDQVREDDLCTRCQNTGYPECRENCQGYKFLKADEEKNRK